MSARLSGATRLLYIGPLVTMFDRYSIAPLLIPIALDLHRPLAQVTVVASLYFFLYGSLQLVYGLLSDRFGRVRVMRTTLAGMAGAGLVSALSPNLEVLLAGRALTGALACATMPAALVYIGDRFEFRVRQQAVSDLLAAVAVGTTLATVGAGVLAHLSSWRLVFLVTAAAALVVSVGLRGLPESLPKRTQASVPAQLRRCVTHPWAVFVNLFAPLEGAAMLGFITFFAPALEAHGENAATAGLTTAGYGVSLLILTFVMRRHAARVPGHLLIFVGGACLALGYLVAAWRQDIASILVATALAGAAYSVMHSTFQTWATDTVPEARGTATSIFVTGIFLGAALGTQLMAGLAGRRDFHDLFLVAVAVTVPMVVIGGVARWRYPGSETSSAEAEAALGRS